MTTHSSRVLPVLAVAQGFYLSAMSIDLTVTALAGASLAPNPVWSTLPMTAISIGSVIVAPLVSRIMGRLGIKTTLIAGACTAVLGGVFSYLAMSYGVFVLLCLGTFAVGIYQSVANYYRYIASDSRPGQESRSMAIVLSAGVIAAIIGPIIATLTGNLLVPLYSGSYVAVSALGIGAIITLCLLPNNTQVSALPTPANNKTHQLPPGFIMELFARPQFRIGALMSITGCFSMSIVMSGAPLELEHVLHVQETSRMTAMQLHMVGMYAPMLILPLLSKKLSHLIQAGLGMALGIIGLIIGLLANTLTISITLFCIGVAWAITYATGSALLTTSYSESERSYARGIGEFFPVCGLALGSLLAGPLITEMGWTPLTWVCIAFLIMTVCLTFYERKALSRQACQEDRASRKNKTNGVYR